MEDRYFGLLKKKDAFMKTMQASIKLCKSKEGEISDEALMLVEVFKQFYLNYPLKNQSTSVTSCLIDDEDFFSLQEEAIKSFHRSGNYSNKKRSNSMSNEDSISEGVKSVDSGLGNAATKPYAHTEIQSHEDFGSSGGFEYDKKSTSSLQLAGKGNLDSLGSSSVKDVEFPHKRKTKAIHLACGSETIITLIPAPYLLSKIIVRNYSGKHAWLVTEHRVLDYNCLNYVDYNDKAAVYKNMLNLKGEQNIKKEKEEIKEKFVLNNDEELKKANESDALSRILSLFSKHCSDGKIV